MANPFNAVALTPIMREFIIGLVDHINNLPDEELKMECQKPVFRIEYDHPQLFLVGSCWSNLSLPDRASVDGAFSCRLRGINPAWQTARITFSPVGGNPLTGYVCTAILQI